MTLYQIFSLLPPARKSAIMSRLTRYNLISRDDAIQIAEPGKNATWCDKIDATKIKLTDFIHAAIASNSKPDNGRFKVAGQTAICRELSRVSGMSVGRDRASVFFELLATVPGFEPPASNGGSSKFVANTWLDYYNQVVSQFANMRNKPYAKAI